MAAHSVGGVMTQDFLVDGAKDSDLFIGQALMGAVLNRDKMSINADGSSAVDYSIPTLSITGTRDGFTRVSRSAESYWHQVKNVQKSQSNLFPMELLDGVSHYQFASDNIPSTILDGDLTPTVDLNTAHKQVGTSMAGFFSKVVAGKATPTSKATDSLVAPMVSAMEMEGYTNLKPPCNTSDLINAESPVCYKGTPWVNEHLLETWLPNPMPWNKHITVTNNDNFHNAATVYPYHHPEIEGICDEHMVTDCSIMHVSNTEGSYNIFDDWKLSYKPISAYEVKTKIKSNQYLHKQAGNPEADYAQLDQQGDECANINQAVLDWALATASKDAAQNYKKNGTQMLFGPDKESLNGGSWIPDPLHYKEDTSANTVTLTSKTVVTDESEEVPIFKSMHYCKLLSPFRAMEFIYVDSLYANQGLKQTASLFLQ